MIRTEVLKISNFIKVLSVEMIKGNRKFSRGSGVNGSPGSTSFS